MGWSAVSQLQLAVRGVVQVSFGGQLWGLYINLSA